MEHTHYAYAYAYAMQEGPGPKQITSSTHIIIFNSRCDMLGTLTPPPPPAPSKCTGMGMVCLRNCLHAPLCRWCLGALPAPSAGSLRTAGLPLPVESWYSAGPPLPVEPWCSAGLPLPVV